MKGDRRWVYEYVAKKFSALREGGALSMRKLAHATGIPKSSVARHRQALAARSQWPEAAFWEQEAGYQWLRVLVFAVIFIFGIKGGMGAERLSEFFHRVRLDGHVGSSPTALRRLQGQLEEAIVAYPTAHETELRQAGRGVEICVGADETFFDQVILVMMDLVSGYIVLEEPAEDRCYATWRARAEQALTAVGLKVRYVVSDRAKALVKLALDGLACPSIPDVFHALRDLAKVVGVSLHLKLARLEEKRAQAQQTLSQLQVKGQERRIQQRFIAHLNEEVAMLQTDQTNAQALLRDASSAVHPFTLAGSARQNAVQVEAALHQVLASLNTLRERYTARDNTKVVAKFTRQIPGLAALVDAWWHWVEQSLPPDTLDAEFRDWLLERLLPTVYWQAQVAKTTTLPLKSAYQHAFDNARQTLHQHPLSATLRAEDFAIWQAWAMDWVGKFQRASSPVEGRNGYLSQLNHCARGTPARRLKVLTVIHNFDLQRADGTTAAERLFGTPFPDVFDWVMERMGALPLPRKARSPAKPKLLNLQPVPP
jgi:hypothetical protein